MKNLNFEPRAQKEIEYWRKIDKAITKKIVRLIEEILQTPYHGTGKPEPLKHELSGCWSRRIDKEHRIVYRVEGEEVVILSCRFHYWHN